MAPIFLRFRSQFAYLVSLILVHAAHSHDARAQLSGTYHSAPGSTVTYQFQHDGFPATTLPADITVTFSADGPATLIATIHQPIIGDIPGDHNFEIARLFPIVVTGTSTNGHRFQGELLDNSQYFFDWQFDPTNSGNLSWHGTVAWVGGRIEISTLDAGALLVPGVSGDYNLNGMVDAADYAVWRNEIDGGGAGRADGNQDGNVDAADYDIWKSNFGQVAAGSALNTSAIPEPATILSLLLGVLPIMIGRRAAAR
jgi:hypothetical protein